MRLSQKNCTPPSVGIRGLHTVFDPGEASRHVVVADSRTDQDYFNPGIAAAFTLPVVPGQSRKPQWQDLAIEYMRFAEGASDELFALIRAGKVGWADSLLFRISGAQEGPGHGPQDRL